MNYSTNFTGFDRFEKLIAVLSFCGSETASAIRKEIKHRMQFRVFENNDVNGHDFSAETLTKLKDICNIVFKSYNNWSGDRNYWLDRRNELEEALNDIKKTKEFLKHIEVGDFVQPTRKLISENGNTIINIWAICEVKAIYSNAVVVRLSGTAEKFEIRPYKLILIGKKYKG